MLSMIITGIIITIIIVIAVVMHYMGNILSEFNDHFLHLTVFLLVFLIGAAVYMSYSLPTVASSNTLDKKRPDDIKVYRDSPPSKTVLEMLFEE